MYPHERSLVKRLEGKPFALVGVNTDKTRELPLEALAMNGLSFRSFWDGRNGPISTRWNVVNFPTIYILDPGGIIRFKNARPDAIDAMVDGLLNAPAGR